MRYQNVCLEAFGYTLPDDVVTTAEIEHRLAPLYSRLRLPEGRLELMTGIRERRFWSAQMLPSEASIVSAARAIAAAEIDPREIGVLIHGSVCRDQLEPATACRVHHQLGLREDCLVYDVSNACLGVLNGIVQIANMIELGQVRAGIVVGTENGRQLVESTISQLNQNTKLTRQDIKLAIASLTIGSASCAVLVTHRDLSKTRNHLRTAAARARTSHYELCQGGNQHLEGGESGILMATDSEQLMANGIATGVATFADFTREANLTAADWHRTFCHQVGATHRKLMLDSLGLPIERDFATLEWLGNTGSAALPVTLAIGLEQGVAQAGDQLALLGIGSGINCLMLGVEFQQARVLGEASLLLPNAQRVATPRPHFQPAAATAVPPLP
jgi:3-oxoacyl-[acyl-carrier-protein] synthase-3